ncbi:hypothetical protein TNCV_1853661 [Trichonephila clavipes]|nr:hypothetical protein TNCV_1853661 [Trichonephila clavipes]
MVANFVVVFVTSCVEPEGRKIRSEYLPFRTQVLYRPRQNYRLRVMVGTSLYRYHTATYPHVSDSANERYYIRGEHVSSCFTLWVASIVCDGLRIASFCVRRLLE